MFSLFYKIRTGKKGQLAALLTVILVIFIVIAFLTVNLGKIGLNRTRASNATDAAALAAGSVASVLLNTMANFNDAMVMNFLNFTMGIHLMFVLGWTVDYILLLIAIAEVLIPPNTGINVVLNMANLSIDTLTIGLCIQGTKKIGRAVEKMIDETNDEIPKKTLGTGRLYAFMNAGIDEPKISYTEWRKQNAKPDDDDETWKEYLNLETGFDRFMHWLSSREVKENPDPYNDGTPYLWYAWQDKRAEGRLTTNTVKVTVTPFSKLNLETIIFGDISDINNPGLRNELKNLVDSKGFNWFLSWYTKLAIDGSPAIPGYILRMKLYIGYLILVLTIIATIAFTEAAVQAAACAVGCVPCCVEAARLTAVGGNCIWAGVIAAATEAALVGTDWFVTEDISCFMREQGTPDRTLTVEMQRTQNPGFTNYGVWKTGYPPIRSFSKAELGEEGEFFPPSPVFDAIIKEAK